MPRYILQLKDESSADATVNAVGGAALSRAPLTSHAAALRLSLASLPQSLHRVVAASQSLAGELPDVVSSAAAARAIGGGTAGGLSLLMMDLDDASAAVARTHSSVVFIELDVPLRLHETVESDPGPALDRIDQRGLPLDGLFHYALDGSGVDVYVLDSGLRATHEEFSGRVIPGQNFAPDRSADDTSDCEGHGTHVTSLAAGTRFGVAKGASIIPVRIYDCTNSGSLSQALLGIDFVLVSMNSRPGKRAVINMSFGGDDSRVLDAALQRLHEGGAVVAVAAGNDHADACAFSPANAPDAITVGSTALDDTISSFSNNGRCVSLFAPGEMVVGADYLTDTGVRLMSGTS